MKRERHTHRDRERREGQRFSTKKDDSRGTLVEVGMIPCVTLSGGLLTSKSCTLSEMTISSSVALSTVSPPSNGTNARHCWRNTGAAGSLRHNEGWRFVTLTTGGQEGIWKIWWQRMESDFPYRNAERSAKIRWSEEVSEFGRTVAERP